MSHPILIVEDDLAMSQLLVEGLARRGYAPQAANSGDQALSLLKQHDFQAVVTDVNMKGIDGLTLCERIVTGHPGLPVLVITAFGSMDTAIKAIRVGAYDFLNKPFELEALTLALGRAVQHKQLREEVKRLRDEAGVRKGTSTLLGKSNGYVLEQILSPLVVAGGEFLAELRLLAKRFVTRTSYHHYRAFLQTQRKMFAKEEAKKAKTLLYAYRVAFTGIHLLRTGEVQPHLPTLNETFRRSYIPELIERKRAAEVGRLPDLDAAFHLAELDRLDRELEAAHAASTLPDNGPFDELNDFLVRARLGDR